MRIFFFIDFLTNFLYFVSIAMFITAFMRLNLKKMFYKVKHFYIMQKFHGLNKMLSIKV